LNPTAHDAELRDRYRELFEIGTREGLANVRCEGAKFLDLTFSSEVEVVILLRIYAKFRVVDERGDIERCTTLPSPNQPCSQEICSFFVSQSRTSKAVIKYEFIEFRDFLEEITEDKEASVELPGFAIPLFLITRISGDDDTSIDGRRSGRRVRVRRKALDRWVGDTVEVSEMFMRRLVSWASITTDSSDFLNGRLRAPNSKDVFDIMELLVNGSVGVTSEEEDPMDFLFEGLLPVGNV
jgi:hypothetical protein